MKYFTNQSKVPVPKSLSQKRNNKLGAKKVTYRSGSPVASASSLYVTPCGDVLLISVVHVPHWFAHNYRYEYALTVYVAGAGIIIDVPCIDIFDMLV